MKCYQKDYPRPQLARKEWENLNGSWQFAFDDACGGVKAGWHNSLPQGKTITVPFTYETKLSGIGDEGFHPCVWYSREIMVPNHKLSGRALLHLEGCDYITDVWINGIHAGSHAGGYARFSFDIADYLAEGANTITIRAQDSFDDRQPRGKQRWIDSNYGCWYVQTTGIWKTVWLEYVSQSYIKSVKMTPNMTGKSILVEAAAETGRGCAMIEAEVTFGDRFVAKAAFSLVNGVGKTEIPLHNTNVFEWGVQTWTPRNPNLYDIAFTLTQDGEAVDNVLSYFGMREINIRNGQILLNNEMLYQRLILDQGYWKDSHLTPPSEEALIEDIDKIFALGYNGLRKHQKTEDERFLYWCDVKGMLVWSEMAASYRYDDFAVEQFTSQWMEIVRQNYNHPCIITWTPFNESWGVPNILTDGKQQKFTEAIYYLTKAFDPYRPVICNDGWEHTISDIITLHDYHESGDALYEKYLNHKDDILNNKWPESNSKYAFAHGYEYKGQPIIITEYGGIAFKDESGWGYGNQVATKEDFIKRFDSVTSAILRIPYICGFCYTQVSDVQQEVNGLMDMERNFKVDPDKIKEINTKTWWY